MEFKFDKNFRIIGDPFFFKIFNCLFCNSSRILVKLCAICQEHITESVKYRMSFLFLDKRRQHIRFRDHIRFMNFGIAEIGSIKTDPVF